MIPTEPTNPDGAPLRLRHHFRAPRNLVYAAFTEADHLKAWWATEANDIRLTELDVRPGGRYRMEIRYQNGTLQVLFGTYLDVEPPERLRFTWEWTHDGVHGGESQVEMLFHDLGDATELELTHGPFPTPESRAQHTKGWEGLFGMLTSHLVAQSGDSKP